MPVRVYKTYTSSEDIVFIELIQSPKAYSNFVNTIDLNDKLGVTTISRISYRSNIK